MKAWNIRISAVILLLFPGIRLKAQLLETLKPDYVVLQHAGSIGYMSIGGGYELFKNDRGSLEFDYGYVPKNRGGTLHIATTKFAYRPFRIKIKDKVSIFPLNPGVFFSYHFGKQFGLGFDRDQYGKSYYGWSTALRGHISVSNEIKLHTGNKNSVSIYSEFNTNDLSLVSMFYKNNSQWLSPEDIVKLGVGVKVGF